MAESGPVSLDAVTSEQVDATGDPERTVRPAPDPARLLASWMQWEKGEATPGRVMADLKKGGLRDVLEALATTGESGTA